jgi:hypothetical protein
MPMTYAEHDKKMKVPAVCELLPLRDLPEGDNVMVRTNGAFVAGYECSPTSPRMRTAISRSLCWRR